MTKVEIQLNWFVENIHAEIVVRCDILRMASKRNSKHVVSIHKFVGSLRRTKMGLKSSPYKEKFVVH